MKRHMDSGRAFVESCAARLGLSHVLAGRTLRELSSIIHDLLQCKAVRSEQHLQQLLEGSAIASFLDVARALNAQERSRLVALLQQYE